MSSRPETSLTATAAPGGALAAGEVLARYLSTQATELLRGLRDLPAQDASAEAGAAAVAGAVHDAAFRIADTLGSFGPLLDAEWAERLEGELYWLGTTVLREHVYAARRDRLVGALRRLSGEEEPGDLAVGGAGAPVTEGGRHPAVGGVAARDAATDATAGGGAGARDPRAAVPEGPGPGSGVAEAVGTGLAGGALPGARPGGDGEAAPAPTGGTRGAGPAAATAAAAEQRPGGGSRTSAGATREGRPRDGAPGHAFGTSAAGAASDAASSSGAASAGAGLRASGSSGPRSGAFATAAPAPGSGRVSASGTRRTGVASTAAPGAARAAALLERRLGLARSRAHSEALDALTSARYHALADAVALLVSDAPLTGAARRPAAALPRHHDELRRLLAAAVTALPLARAGRPYNAAALARGLAAPRRAAGTPAADDRDDAPWRHVHALLRRARHAAEILAACPPGTVPVRPAGPPLPAAGAALDRDREAVEAAAAAAAAAATPRIAPATAYALGVLHADQRHEVEAARFTFGRLWQTQQTRGEQE